MKKVFAYCSVNKTTGNAYLLMNKNYSAMSDQEKLSALSDIMDEIKVEIDFINSLNTSSSLQSFDHPLVRHDGF